MDNLYSPVPSDLPDELTQVLLQEGSVRIERIVSEGHASPPDFWYDQDEHEWVAVLTGEARLMFEGEQQPLELQPGDCVHIPAHKRHRVEWTSPGERTIWLAVFYR